MVQFKDKWVLITGAAQGIGRALALAYSKAGAKIIIFDKDQKYLNEIRDRIINYGGEVIAFALDLTDVTAIEHAFTVISKSPGSIDILINNAGVAITKSLETLTIEEWDYVMNTNLRAAFVCSQETVRIMKTSGIRGSIVNIASTRALMSEPDTFPYSASKGGLLALTHSLAVSLGEIGIRVNAISPGWIETRSYDKLSETDHKQHPSGRVGFPQDIAKACFYLTDPENDFVTGINLVVDGGMTRKMIYEE